MHKLKSLIEGGLINELMGLLIKFKDLVKTCFNNDGKFERARQSGFEAFINKDIGAISIPELLACYSDKFLRKQGSSRENYETLENQARNLI